ncbi:MAG TPA: glycosyltransferase, partial [Gemmatimonadaceae bacterium]|nr:glycosyltransferase [Gemmatimonadaceae bacterium]
MNPLPRVRFLVNSFADGGTERQAVLLANALHQSGRWLVRVDSLEPGGPLANVLDDALRLARKSYPLEGFMTIGACRALAAFATSLRSDRVDVLHTHGFYPNVFGMAAGALAGVPVRIASKRESVALRSGARRRIERVAFALATRVVANCNAVRDELVGEGIGSHRIVVIPNAVDPRRIPAAEPDACGVGDAARARVPGTNGGGPRLVAVTNFHHAAKDHATLLRALRRVVGACPDAHLTIAGDGPRIREVTALVQSLGLGAHVHLAGRCE